MHADAFSFTLKSEQTNRPFTEKIVEKLPHNHAWDALRNVIAPMTVAQLQALAPSTPEEKLEYWRDRFINDRESVLPRFCTHFAALLELMVRSASPINCVKHKTVPLQIEWSDDDLADIAYMAVPGSRMWHAMDRDPQLDPNQECVVPGAHFVSHPVFSDAPTRTRVFWAILWPLLAQIAADDEATWTTISRCLPGFEITINDDHAVLSLTHL